MSSVIPPREASVPDQNRVKKALSALWLLALLFAVVNGLFLVRRVPILHIQNQTPDELAAQAAAVWLRQEPTDARLLLLRSHQDLRAVWFNFRLNYLIYPRRHDSAWETLPPKASRNYDLVLALGTARAGVPPDWRPLRRTGWATLFAPPAPSHRLTGSLPAAPHSPTPVGILAGIFALAVVIALGALLLGWTTAEAPFPHWWANLAIAHLIGATAMAWLVSLIAIATDRLLLWPVYLLLALLLPGARRAYDRIRSRRRQERVEGDSQSSTLTQVAGQFHPSHLALPAVIGLGLVMTLLNAWLIGVGWDGYAIWQFKAEAFLIDGDLRMLHDLHYADYAHLDYPLLVSLQTWWVGAHAGGYNGRWGQAIGWIFELDLVALFIGFARPHLSRLHLLMGVALLVTAPELSIHAVSGFADVEMACYLLAMAVLLSRVVISGDRHARPVLAWIFAGIAMVKNEGLLAVVAGLIVLAILQRPRDLAAMAGYAMAAVAAYLPWFARRRAWQLHNDLLESGRTPHFTTGLVIWRLVTALKGFVLCLAQTGPRAGGWGLLILLLPVGLVQTLRRRIALCYPLWLLCAVQLVGYVAIYILTPHALLEHLASSVQRLTLHLIPPLLLAALLGTFSIAEDRTTISTVD